MKAIKLLVSSLIAGCALMSCGTEVGKVGKIRNQRDSVSYALGLSAGFNYKQSINQFPGNVELSPETLFNGIADGFKGSTKINKDEAKSMLENYFVGVQAKAMAMAKDSTGALNADTVKIKATNNGLKNIADSLSYAIGANTGLNYVESLKNFPGNITPDNDMILAGFRDAMIGDSASAKLTNEEVGKVLNTYFEDAQKVEALKAAEKAEAARKENAKWLEENKKSDSEIKETPSGLQYKIITAGTGELPKAESTVKVHYTGKLTNGKVFDSSINRGEPATFPVGAVIRGWTEALQMMPVGSKWELYIPSDLAYGARDMGDIPANSILIFEVELLEIVK